MISFTQEPWSADTGKHVRLLLGFRWSLQPVLLLPDECTSARDPDLTNHIPTSSVPLLGRSQWCKLVCCLALRSPDTATRVWSWAVFFGPRGKHEGLVDWYEYVKTTHTVQTVYFSSADLCQKLSVHRYSRRPSVNYIRDLNILFTKRCCIFFPWHIWLHDKMKCHFL